MAEPGPFEIVLGEIGKALLPLKAGLDSPDAFYALMLRLGWRAETIPEPLAKLGGSLSSLFDELQALAGGGLSIDGSVSIEPDGAAAQLSVDGVLRLQQALRQTIDGIRTIAAAPDAAFPAALQADGFKTQIPKQLLNHLLIEYLTRHQTSLASLLRTAGVIKTAYEPPSGNRPARLAHRLDFADLPAMLSSPWLVLERGFGWGRDDFDFDAFAAQLDNLFMTLGVDVTWRAPSRGAAAAFVPLGADETALPRALAAVFFERLRPSGRMAAEVRVLRLPKDGAHKPGLAILPAFNGVLDFKMELGPDIAVTVDSDLDLQGGVGLVVRPGEGIDMLLGFDGAGAPTHATGSIRVRAERGAPSGTPIIVLGTADGTRLQYRTLGGVAGVGVDAQNAVDLFGELEARGLEFVFDPGDADGFIQTIFPAGGAAVGIDLALGLSLRRGVYFRGTTQLEIAVPAHIDLGPLDLQSLTIAVKLQADRLPIDLGVSFKLALGPLTAVVENIGLRADLAFPAAEDGNLGPVDLRFGFKPPNGIGLSLDAGVVSGGGYLYFDPDKAEYAGALELSFAEVIDVKAVGLLSTRLPDGSPGFSLLIIITAEFGTGIQLGLGFVLLGVGGLIGLNRTVKLQPLMDAVRSGALESVLFPKDVIANAPKIISDLRALFPPQDGIFLIGPMAKLGWGTPAIVSVSLGVIIEIPGNLAIVGILKLALPADDVAILVLQVNFAGAIEFDKQRLFFFAALFESRILFLPIEGELGLLVAWGDDANLVLSVGGFHPRFMPPPLPFPSPNRVSITLVSTPVQRVRVEGYFAVTSNTVQFGARAELFFGLSAFNVQGHIAFDALFQFSPFQFIIEVSASFGVKAFGVGLFSVRIRGSLQGPTPWRARGEGSISLLFFDISVDFDVTWGESRDTTLPPIAVMPLLTAEFEKAANWRALLPAGARLLVALRPLPPGDTSLVLHPVGVLRVSQRRLPLELTLDTVGNQKPSDVKRLRVSVAGGGLAKIADTLEQFPPAQFTALADADKLSRPAFGWEIGGLDLSASGNQLASARMVKRVVRYEEIILDSNFKRFARRFSAFTAALFQFFLGANSAARSALSQTKAKQVQPFAETVTVASETYVVASQATNQAVAPAARHFASEASAREYLAQHAAADASLADAWHVIPAFEEAA
jgi:hypothetical protein